MPKVMIHPATYENVHQALDQAFDFFPLELEGKKVFIKPNLLRASDAREGIVTHPAVLRGVVEKVEAMRPASIVVGDNPGLSGYGANEESFKKTCLMEAAKGYYQNIGSDSRKVDFNPDFKLPPLSGEVDFRNKTLQGILYSRTLLRPQADPKLCTGCRTCVEQCPVSALSISNQLPRVAPDACIICFCCQENCPEKAITLR